MSRKGGQVGLQHGGAQAGTHERHLDSDYLVTDTLFENGIDYNSRGNHEEAPARCVQNGGQSGCAVGELQLLSDCDSNLDSFTYERNLSEHSEEWLKSRCKGLDFDCVVKENDNPCDSADELFPEQMSEVEDGSGVAGEKPVNIRNRTIEAEPLTKLETPTVISNEDFANQGVTVHFGEFPSGDLKGTNPEGFPLQIMHGFQIKNESVALMTPQELESLPHRGLEFEDSLVFSSPTFAAQDSMTSISIKSNQEDSETLTSSQLSSVSSNQLSSVSSSQLSSASVKNEQSTTGISNECIESIDENPAEINKANTDDEGDAIQDANIDNQRSELLDSSSSESSDSESELSQPDVNSRTEQRNLTLATISISTDKAANSTQILVNTNQGQQLYLINTADLTQATNALQPLAQPSLTNKLPATELSSSVGALPTAAEVRTLSEVENAFQVQPQVMPLQIQSTGYLLVPVAQQEGGGNGILVTSPLGSVPAEFACPSRKVWACPESGCGKVFRKLSKLRIHEMRHTGERPFKCSRIGCDWAFTTAYKLKRHEESHEGRKDYNCDFPGCGRKFTTVYNLNSHRKLHERPCTETCPESECGQSFPTKRQLDLHVRTHTGMEKTYKCPVSGCDKVFFSPNCMGSHTRVHLQDRQDLTCKFEGCGKVFDKQCRLKQHERRHTGEKPYVCQYPGCKWAFTTASKLKRHKAKHTGLRKWVCEVCNKGFMRAEHLKGHLVTHSGVKPFICPVEGCKARFTAKSSLYVHLKKHDASGKKITYHCPMEGCLRNYSSKVGLRNHILKHYLSPPTGTDPNTALDWVPLLGGDDDDNSLDSLTQSPDGASMSSSISQASLATSVLSTAQEQGLTAAAATAADFVNADTSFSDGECMSAEQLSSSIVSQLIANSPLQPTSSQASASLLVTTPTKLLQPFTAQTTTTSSLLKANQATRSLLSSLTQASGKHSTSKSSTGSSESTSGSARTDFRGNHVLSERARRRWHLVKNLTEEDLQDNDEDNMDLESAFSDAIDKTSTAEAASPPFPSTDMLSSSQGVMFRDPETGFTYVQTQLLQDDPPHPVLYDDDNGTGTSTGTTINLQDLK